MYKKFSGIVCLIIHFVHEGVRCSIVKLLNRHENRKTLNPTKNGFSHAYLPQLAQASACAFLKTTSSLWFATSAFSCLIPFILVSPRSPFDSLKGIPTRLWL
jgi:hypothetical protein